MTKKFILLLLLLAVSCKNTDRADLIVSMQTIDRNGFAETISNQDRLHPFQKVNFLSAQPYQKVLRVYGKNAAGKTHTKITSYHPNGNPWQYLEAIDGRANGQYLEWHENGKLQIEANVIEGLADLSAIALKSYLFDKECSVWDEQGNLIASFIYDKGYLEQKAQYYYPDGALQQVIPYDHGIIHGKVQVFDPEGNEIESICYHEGKKDGPAIGYWSKDICKYQEQYRKGLLFNAIYFDPESNVCAEIENGQGTKAIFKEEYLYSLSEYKNGDMEGKVSIFFPNGSLQTVYHVKEEKKIGEEWEYFPITDGELCPKLMVTWFEDKIQGMVKTWYENGTLETQKEMVGNKKHGLSFAYYSSGDLMYMEEYENDRLIKGNYYKKGEKKPISIVENGEGIATLFNQDGHFLKKVTYERNRPLVD